MPFRTLESNYTPDLTGISSSAAGEILGETTASGDASIFKVRSSEDLIIRRFVAPRTNSEHENSAFILFPSSLGAADLMLPDYLNAPFRAFRADQLPLRIRGRAVSDFIGKIHSLHNVQVADYGQLIPTLTKWHVSLGSFFNVVEAWSQAFRDSAIHILTFDDPEEDQTDIELHVMLTPNVTLERFMDTLESLGSDLPLKLSGRIRFCYRHV